MRKSIKAVLSMIFVAVLISATMVVSLAVGNISNLKATNVTHNSATITWSAVSNADGYVLTYKASGIKEQSVTIKSRKTTSYKLTLTPGKNYTVTVKSYDNRLFGKVDYGKAYSVTVKAVPAAVTNFKATNLAGGTSVKFTWTKVSGVTGYTVYRYNTSKKAYVSCGSTTGSTLTVKSLKAGTTYKFRIAAYYKYSGKNIYGSYTNLSATPTYLAPTSLKKSADTVTSITLKWGASSGATKYQVYNATTKKTVNVSKTTATLTGLEPETSYKIRVRAYTGSGSSAVYSPWTSYVTVSTAPRYAAPTSLKKSASTVTSITLKWGASSGATKYQVYNATTKKSVYVSTTTATLTGLEPETSYKIRVRGYTGSGSTAIYGNWTSYVTVATSPRYAAPASLKVTKTATNSVTLTWSKSTGAEKYQVYNYNTKKTVNVSSATATLTGLTAGTSYKIRVRGYSGSGSSAVYGNWTADLSFTTLPAAVNNLKASNISKNGADISFDKAAGALGYQVLLYNYETKAETKLIKQLTTNTYSITGLEAGKTYRIRVCSYVKNSSTYFYSAYSTIFINTPPTLEAGSETTEKDIQLQWSKVRNAYSYKIERYMPKEYNWSTLGEVAVEKVYTGTTLSAEKEAFLDTNFASNTKYHSELYRVTAYAKDGSVINTAEQTVSSTGITFAQNDYTVTVSWDKPANTAYYIVYKAHPAGYSSYFTYNNDFKITDSSKSSYTFQLAPDEYHHYTIYSYPEGGIGGVQVATFTAHMGDLVINSTNNSKNSQVLMLVNAINNTKLYKDDVTVKADSNFKMNLDALYFSDEMLNRLSKEDLGTYLAIKAITDKNNEIAGDKIEKFFKILVDAKIAEESDLTFLKTNESDKVTYKFSNGIAKASNGADVTLRNFIEPSTSSNRTTDLAYLYDQHNIKTWSNGFSSVTTTYDSKTDSYKVVATLKQEKFGDNKTANGKKDAFYHPGFTSFFDGLGFSGQGMSNDLTTYGATKLTAYIDSEGHLTGYAFTSPFTTKNIISSDGLELGMRMSGSVTLNYTLTF